ncbi:protein lifeguard 1 [Cynoglossus semilaevis]|uniref:Zgc:110410 n=1 Tax=Cynoglossus semilaevis TaxID=244447 RepID=A0A3P8VJB9_CYNSE|nr:protein lifeguard 1-like [Cynoglossus semilaevis]
MGQTSSSENVGSGPTTNFYNNQSFEEAQTAAVICQTGKVNVSVVSSSGPYNTASYPQGVAEGGNNQQYGQPPPDYFNGLEDSGFSNATLRRGFIRKVYLTLMLQLLVTVGIICAFLYWDALRIWAINTYWFTYGMMAVTLVLIVVMSCCDTFRRQVPFNFIALGIFTIAEGLMLGSVAALFKVEPVLWAVGATALVSFSLSLFALQSKFDFTTMNAFVWVFAWTLLSFGLLCAILQTKFAYIAYACLGTLLFSLYLVFDTQLIVGGKHRKYEVSPEEYIFAALNLYLDIVGLFLLLLQLIAICDS